MEEKKYCEGIDCAWCLNPYCPLINKERSEQTLKDLEEEKNCEIQKEEEKE